MDTDQRLPRHVRFRHFLFLLLRRGTLGHKSMIRISNPLTRWAPYEHFASAESLQRSASDSD